MNKEGLELAESPITASRLAELVAKVADGTLSSKLAKKAFEAMWAEPEAGIAEIIEKHGLQQITDTGAIEAMVDEVLANNAKAIEQFRSGNEKALNAIVGQVMKASKGKANPAQVQELIKAKLA
ncbi:glutamyl-tRNA(Gln) and/or aspartyl-tRNA(Asn) amidotransferase, B subunit [Mycobacteroides abscessus subsp. massiliense]|nr:glutamyl-tRNA(Gln) and/or aspartyl-tRNA(Asn) amidotransferase, B subunit [Mycobacteroides abscessus subsp. massiliense]